MLFTLHLTTEGLTLAGEYETDALSLRGHVFVVELLPETSTWEGTEEVLLDNLATAKRHLWDSLAKQAQEVRDAANKFLVENGPLAEIPPAETAPPRKGPEKKK